MLKKLSWQLSLFLLGVSLVMVVAADKDGYDDEGKTKIINGAPVDEAHKYPFMAYIRSGRDLNMLRIPMCGASIIDAQWILSAAHCFRSPFSVASLKVGVGSANRMEATEVDVEKVYVHEKFNIAHLVLGYDIALLKLKKPLALDGTTIATIERAKAGAQLPPTITVAGWGVRFEGVYGSSPRTMYEVKLDITEKGKCSRLNRFAVAATHFCTYTDRKDACQGDSGGPLFAYDGEAKKFVQYGLVSAGYGCAAKDSPGLNTDLTKLSDWIEVKMAS